MGWRLPACGITRLHSLCAQEQMGIWENLMDTDYVRECQQEEKLRADFNDTRTTSSISLKIMATTSAW
jgi:hypothetical protein